MGWLCLVVLRTLGSGSPETRGTSETRGISESRVQDFVALRSFQKSESRACSCKKRVRVAGKNVHAGLYCRDLEARLVRANIDT